LSYPQVNGLQRTFTLKEIEETKRLANKLGVADIRYTSDGGNIERALIQQDTKNIYWLHVGEEKPSTWKENQTSLIA